jgi:hypothetical protein
MTQVLKSPVRENPAEPLPVDPYIKARKEIEYVLMMNALIASAVPHHLAHEMPEDKLKRFLENDRKVLIVIWIKFIFRCCAFIARGMIAPRSTENSVNTQVTIL